MNCDIIIPVWNQRKFTEDCIDSIFRNTQGVDTSTELSIDPERSRRVDYSIILIDNASDDETLRYLSELKTAKPGQVAVIRNEKNLGFVKAVNQGIAASVALYVCLLNNDTLVTKGWLKEMIDIAESSADIGIVNPSSNNLGQKPAAGEPLELYAGKIAGESGNSIELGAAIGFCMLIKRKVLETIGTFDEIYGMGNFDDTDFSRRAVQAGYRCVRACGAYVYHRERTSFNKLKAFEDDFKRNREIYEFRWGKPRRIAYILDEIDANSLKRMNIEALGLARLGNWVWYFRKNQTDVPRHSNIIIKDIPGGWFYPKAIFNILKKKKKFNEIFVGEAGVGRILNNLKFIHKATVKYY